MEEKTKQHYILPNYFIHTLHTTRQDYDILSQITTHPVYLVWMDTLPKVFQHFPTDRPTIIKYTPNSEIPPGFKILGQNAQHEWKLTHVKQGDDLLEHFFQQCNIQNINNTSLLPVEQKTIPSEIFKIIQNHKGHYVEHKKSHTLSYFLGCEKDTKTRYAQIHFVQTLLAYYEKQLSQNLFKNEKDYQDYLHALSIMVVAVCFVRQSIDKTYWVRSSHKSILMTLYDHALGLDIPGNTLDKMTKASIFHTAYTALQTGALSLRNNPLLNKTMSLEMWEKFTQFIESEYQYHHKKNKTHFPITYCLIPAISKPMEWTGAAIGIVFAGGLEQSTKLLKTKIGLTSMIGGCMLRLLGSGVTPGVVVLAPTIATTFLKSFCNISFAWIFGKSFKIAGTLIGGTVGLSLDTACLFLGYFTHELASLYKKEMHNTASGIQLINGMPYINGMICSEETPQDLQKPPLPFEEQAHDIFTVQVQKDGLIISTNQNTQTLIPWHETQPQLERLMKTDFLKNWEQEEEIPLSNQEEDKDMEDEKLTITSNPFL